MTLAGGDGRWRAALDRVVAHLPAGAPVTVLVHGYRYAPAPRAGAPGSCPHDLLYRTDDIRISPDERRPGRAAWPRALGYSETGLADGLCVAFGWQGRTDRQTRFFRERPGDFARAYRDAEAAGKALARILGHLGRRLPTGSVGVMAHSLGARVALQAMDRRPDALPGRVLLLGAAEYAGVARTVVEAQDGLGHRVAALPEILSVASRANDLYDALFEMLAPPPALQGDRALGAKGLGRPHPRWMDVQLDHPEVADWLAAQGLELVRLPERVSHWSFYADPAAMAFWRRVLRAEPGWSLAGLRDRGIPETWSPRWSRVPRLIPMPRLPRWAPAPGPGLTES